MMYITLLQCVANAALRPNLYSSRTTDCVLAVRLFSPWDVAAAAKPKAETCYGDQVSRDIVAQVRWSVVEGSCYGGWEWEGLSPLFLLLLL